MFGAKLDDAPFYDFGRLRFAWQGLLQAGSCGSVCRLSEPTIRPPIFLHQSGFRGGFVGFSLLFGMPVSNPAIPDGA